MTCEELQIRLLTADDPAEVAIAADAAAHLASCAECRLILQKLNLVEALTRALPEPVVAAGASQVAFLNRLSGMKSTFDNGSSKTRADRTGRWSAYRLMPRIAAAAAVLLLLLSGIWVLTGDVPSADASSAVVGQLVEWNLNLVQAGSPEERSEIFASAVGPLNQRVAKVKMLPEDQELARMLLDNGRALANNNDPIDDVERLNATADVLLKRIQVATSRGNLHAVHAYSYNYALLRATTSENRLEKLEPPPGENPQRFERLERMIRHDADLRKRLQRLIEQSPAATKREIIESLNLSQHHATTRPAARPTTRPVRPNRPELRDDRPPHRDVIKPATASQEEQQMRERRVREWFKNHAKAKGSATTAPSTKPTSGELQQVPY